MSEVTTKSQFGLPVVLGVLLTVAIVVVVARLPGEPDPAQSVAAAAIPSPSPEQPVRYKLPVSSTQPSVGPADALVTVVEWCDIRGPVCRAANATMRSLMQAHPDKLRWVHRAIVDQARVEDSMREHRLARAAFQHASKFWEMRDWFLAVPDGTTLTDADYERAAEAVGIDYAAAEKAAAARNFDGALQLDRFFLTKFGVRPPLAYFVNGMSVPLAPGVAPEAALKPAIEAELALAEALVAKGTAPAEVYAATIADGAWQWAAPQAATQAQ